MSGTIDSANREEVENVGTVSASSIGDGHAWPHVACRLEVNTYANATSSKWEEFANCLVIKMESGSATTGDGTDAIVVGCTLICGVMNEEPWIVT